MADPIDAAGPVGSPGVYDYRQEAGPREIPDDRNVYAQPADADPDGSEGAADFETAAIDGVVGFVAVQIHGMVTQGASESKRLQDDAHTQLKEAEGENGG